MRPSKKPAKKTTLTPRESLERLGFFYSWVEAACDKATASKPSVDLDAKQAMECLTSAFSISRTRDATKLQAMRPSEIITSQNEVLKVLGAGDAAKLSRQSPVIWLIDTYPTAIPQ